MPRNRFSPSVLPLILVAVMTLLVGLAVQYAAELGQERLRTAAQENAGSELVLLTGFVSDILGRQDYQGIDNILRKWGEVRKDTVEIRLVSANGFVLGNYKRQGSMGETLFLSQEITYSYRGAATLELTKDLSGVREAAHRQLMELTAAAGVVLVGVLLLAWNLLLRRRENAKLRSSHVELNLRDESLDHATLGLQRLRLLLSGVLDAMPSVLIGVDTRGCVVEWNRGAAELTHIAREDALGLPFAELIPHLAKYEQEVRTAIEDNGERRLPRLTQVTGGTVRYSDLWVYPLSEGEEKMALIRVDDATQRVRFEQMMVQNEKMLSLGGLAAGVAHEINSPLSGVLQNSQNIARRLSADLATNRQVAAAVGLDLERLQDYLRQRKVPEFIDMVREAAERASLIVTDMLAFSRRNPQGHEKVAVSDLLETAIRLASNDFDMRKNLNFRHIEIQKEFAPDLPLIHCDRTRIEQVFLNLLKNAAQAMASADTPSPRRILLRTRIEAEQLRIDVEDNGPGIEPRMQQKVFEPFFTTKPLGQGIGLGLSVSQFIVKELHQGSIQVEPEHEGGARFVIRLPMKGDQGDSLAGFSRN